MLFLPAGRSPTPLLEGLPLILSILDIWHCTIWHWTIWHWTIGHWTIWQWTIGHWTIWHWTIRHWTIRHWTIWQGTIGCYCNAFCRQEGHRHLCWRSFSITIWYWTLDIGHQTIWQWIGQLTLVIGQLDNWTGHCCNAFCQLESHQHLCWRSFSIFIGLLRSDIVHLKLYIRDLSARMLHDQKIDLRLTRILNILLSVCLVHTVYRNIYNASWRTCFVCYKLKRRKQAECTFKFVREGVKLASVLTIIHVNCNLCWQ